MQQSKIIDFVCDDSNYIGERLTDNIRSVSTKLGIAMSSLAVILLIFLPMTLCMLLTLIAILCWAKRNKKLFWAPDSRKVHIEP